MRDQTTICSFSHLSPVTLAVPEIIATTEVNGEEPTSIATVKTTVEISAPTDTILNVIDDLGISVDPNASAVAAAADIVDAMMEETCEVDVETGLPAEPEVCIDESTMQRAKSKFKGLISKTLSIVKSSGDNMNEADMDMDDDDEEDGTELSP